jgi:hypothetical protein
LATPHFTTDFLPVDAREAFTDLDPWRCMHLAIGVSAGLLEIAPNQALAQMRAYAFTNDMLLSDLAIQVLGERIGPPSSTANRAEPLCSGSRGCGDHRARLLARGRICLVGRDRIGRW